MANLEAEYVAIPPAPRVDDVNGMYYKVATMPCGSLNSPSIPAEEEAPIILSEGEEDAEISFLS
jgi:hypothetical protein